MTGPEILLLMALLGSIAGWVVAEIRCWKLRKKNEYLNGEIRLRDEWSRVESKARGQAEAKIVKINDIIKGYSITSQESA